MHFPPLHTIVALGTGGCEEAFFAGTPLGGGAAAVGRGGAAAVGRAAAAGVAAGLCAAARAVFCVAGAAAPLPALPDSIACSRCRAATNCRMHRRTLKNKCMRIDDECMRIDDECMRIDDECMRIDDECMRVDDECMH